MRSASTAAASPGAACIDMNDRACARSSSSLGGVANGFPREDGFDITVASEVMAIFCLAKDLDDLKTRLGNIIVGLHARPQAGARRATSRRTAPMAVLLKDALAPNLVQTLEGTPAFIHGGPFANIAHGCNSVLATTTALKLADYVVTEAGFGADLGRREVHRHQVPQDRPDARCASCWSRPSARSRCTAASRRKSSRPRT